jgi:hypothetical protein
VTVVPEIEQTVLLVVKPTVRPLEAVAEIVNARPPYTFEPTVGKVIVCEVIVGASAARLDSAESM